MSFIINWCNTNQGFAVVALTFIYVIATIFIYRAAKSSVRVSEKAVRVSNESVTAMYDNISLEQYIQNQNIKLALFDKRYEVYEAIKKFLIQTSNEENLTGALIGFSSYIGKSEFLFEIDLVEYLKELRSKISEYRLLGKQYEAACKNNKDVTEITEKQFDLANYFIQVVDNDLSKAFDRYLNFKNIGIEQ